MAVPKQPLDEMATYKAGPAGHQTLHFWYIQPNAALRLDQRTLVENR